MKIVCEGLLPLVIWNDMIACKLLALDKNTWNHLTVCKELLLFNGNSYFKPFNCAKIISIK